MSFVKQAPAPLFIAKKTCSSLSLSVTKITDTEGRLRLMRRVAPGPSNLPFLIFRITTPGGLASIAASASSLLVASPVTSKSSSPERVKWIPSRKSTCGSAKKTLIFWILFFYYLDPPTSFGLRRAGRGDLPVEKINKPPRLILGYTKSLDKIFYL